METRYPKIAEVMKNEFSYLLEVNRDEGVASLLKGIEEGYYDRQALKQEYDQALLDANCKWIEFAIMTKMFWDKESYSNEDVINYIKYYLHEVIYPEDKITPEESKIVLNTALEILKNLQSNQRWIELDSLYLKIIESTGFKGLPYYRMYYLLLRNDYKIEGKAERGKKKEKISVRHK